MCCAGPIYSCISRLILRLVSVSYSSPYPDTSRCMQPACLHNIQTSRCMQLDCLHNIWTSRPLPSFQTSMSSHIWPSGIHTLRHPYLSTPTPLDACSKPAYIMSRPPDLVHTHSAHLPSAHPPSAHPPLACLPSTHPPSIHPRFIQHTQSGNQHSAPFRHTPVSSYPVVYLSVTYVSPSGYLYSHFCLLIFVTVHLQVHLLMIHLHNY